MRQKLYIEKCNAGFLPKGIEMSETGSTENTQRASDGLHERNVPAEELPCLEVIAQGGAGAVLRDSDTGKFFLLKHDSLRVKQELQKAQSLVEKRKWKKKWFLISSYVAFLLVAYPFVMIIDPLSFSEATANNAFLAWAIALVVAMGAMIWFADDLTSKSSSFIDADDAVQRQKISAKSEEGWLRSLAKKFSKSAASVSDIRPDISTEFDDDMLGGFESVNLVPRDRFERYMREIVLSLDSQINLSERKASILLDKGTSYIRNGIIFYVLSIIAWQIIERNTPLSTIAILGMVSCSLTFLVIEFLAAWFLRQYRSFVDASTNLIRVKSVFSRNLLAYFGMKEFSLDEDVEAMASIRTELLAILSQDIKWPDVHVGPPGDFNHMMEMFDSFTKFVDKAKGLVRPEKSEG